MAKKWLQGAIKHPGRLTKAAAASGVSKMQKAEEWSHSSDPSKRGAGLLGKRLIKGKLHDGGQITEDGLYEMQKGEVVIPAGMGQGKVSNVREARSNVMNHQENVEAFPNTDGSMEHSGYWEIDGNSAKFVAGETAKSTAGHHSDPPKPAGKMPGKYGYSY